MILPARENLIEALLALLKGTEKDYSTNLVVFPGKRPAHFLRKALAEKVRASFIPPAILSMDDFVNWVYERKEGVPQKRLEAIDAVAILFDLQKKAPKTLGGENFISPDAFFPIGLKIYSDMEELYLEGVSPSKLKEVESLAREGIPPISRERLRDLSFFYEEFYRWTFASGYSTRSFRYRAICEEMEESSLASYQQVFFAGFFAFTRSEKALFRKLFSSEKVHFLFKRGPGIDEKLAELGIEAEKEQGEEGDTPEFHFYQSPDTHGQVFALSALLGEKLEAGTLPDERTAIVLPSSDTLFPLLHQSLSLLREGNWNISLGYPLHRTPVYGFFNNLMDLISSMDGDRVYGPDYLKFVLHPYTKNIRLRENAEITRILFHTLEEELTTSKARTFLTLSEIEENSGLFEEVSRRVSKEGIALPERELRDHLKEIHQNTIGKFLSFRNVQDFAIKAIGILDFLFHESTARLHRFFHPFTEAFIQSLDSLARSLMRNVVFEKRASYFTLFRRYLLTQTTPFEGTPVRGLQVLGVLETRNLSFDRVFVLDVNEEVLPDTRKEDSLLPFKVREVLGLPTYLDRDQLAAYYFETLWRGAQEVHLFFVENDQKEKSRFIEQLLWEKQKRDRVIKPERYFHKVQYQINLKNKTPGEIKKTPEMVNSLRQVSYSATALDTYLDCPQEFCYRYLFGLEKKEEVSGEIERTDIGRFVHSVLSQYFGRRKGRRLRATDIDLEEMDGLIEELFQRDYGRDPVGSFYLLKQQVKAHLRDFLKNYTLPLARERPVSILEVEHTIHANHQGFVLTGRLDHVEKQGERICIVDYKTSSSPERLKIRFDKLDIRKRESWREAIGTLQLPFYLLLYSKAQGKEIEDLEAIFLLLGKVLISREIELPLFESPDGMREKFGRLQTVISSLLREIVDPGLPFHPTTDLKNLCPKCDFNPLCGTQWVTR
ncbi:MAG TPA: PD-(D/E)XK nuclease family protein [Thermodesulfobacteriota bacterium]|nr:PD-(D/E)XK nuclease family protein [Thermodesulfobacteriota bacterium]